MEATAIKERPILFRAEMVRAILDGRKRQTRRLVKPQPIESPCNPPVAGEKGAFYVCPDWFPTAEQQGSVLVHCEEVGTYHCMGKKQFIDNHCPYGQPGDRLWVREAWAIDGSSLEEVRARVEDVFSGTPLEPLGPYYRATEVSPDTLRWRPSIHMPRWASRITLEVTEVRVERLQAISPLDAWDEGFTCGCTKPVPMCAGNIEAFRASWDSHNAAPFDWRSNPYVWVVSFRYVEQGVRA